MTVLDRLLEDLAAEGDDLDAIVSSLSDDQWSAATPAEGWSIAVQIAHLCWTDTVAAQAASDPAVFLSYLDELVATLPPEQLASLVDNGALGTASKPKDELLADWRFGRSALVDALRNVPAGQKVPWFGPPMSATSMATARLMETWAHGQDVVDTLGIDRKPTARLVHVAHIGVRTRDFAFQNRGMEAPREEFLVELTAPDGSEWSWGPSDAEQSVTGPALDFCLLVTQRRNRADLNLVAEGAGADTWLDIAQAFAGPSGAGRKPSKPSK